MKENLTNNKGNSLIELIMVMMLISLFGITIYTLIFSGSRTQQRINSEKNAQVDARIALSYLNVKIRQNDVAGRISVEENEETGQNAIVIRDRGEYDYDTWIYYADGKILEYLGSVDELPYDDFSNTIVEIKGFKTEYDSETNSIINTVYYDYDTKEKEMSSTIKLRTQQ